MIDKPNYYLIAGVIAQLIGLGVLVHCVNSIAGEWRDGTADRWTEECSQHKPLNTCQANAEVLFR